MIAAGVLRPCFSLVAALLVCLCGFRVASAAVDLPLIDAVRAGNVDQLRGLLTPETDPDTPDLDGTTPLHWAAHQDDLVAAEVLLAAGARTDLRNRYGATALLVAATNGSPSMLERLLAAGADPNISLPEGESALMRTARTGRTEGVRALLARGACCWRSCCACSPCGS